MNDDMSWVKFYRKTKDNVFLMNDNNAYIVFSKLFLFVNRQGEYAAGRNALGDLLNINPRTLYDVLIRLETQQLVNITSNKRYSIITICNWKKYQSNPTTSPTAAHRSPNNDPTMTQHYNKNKKENKNNIENGIEKTKTAKSRASRENVERVRKMLEEKGIYRKKIIP